ncbi:MAG: hypothetical protein ACRBN8_19115 [Nannocystales bacterium]
MSTQTTRTLSISLLGLMATACLVPNVICYEKTYSVSGMMFGSAPLNDELLPADLALRCVDASSGFEINLEDEVGAVEQVHSGQTEISDQADLQRLDHMMTAIEAGVGSSMPAADQNYYTGVIETMVAQMHDECVVYLSDEDINCTSHTADIVCRAYLQNPTRARYLDLDMGEEYVRPISENSGSYAKGADGWCYYYKNPPPQGSDTEDATGGGDESSSTSGGVPPNSSGDDGSSSADESSGGADEGSGGADEGEVAPFGPLAELVHCNQAQTSCTYDPALIDSVFAAASVVEADGALLRLLDPAEPGYPGIRLEGFDREEASTDLAATVGLRNGDILRSVDGKALTDQESLSAVLERLLTHPAGTFVYDRDGRSREVRIEAR